jgi:hypothetical protein
MRARIKTATAASNVRIAAAARISRQGQQPDIFAANNAGCFPYTPHQIVSTAIPNRR